jgi:hypothetical protein
VCGKSKSSNRVKQFIINQFPYGEVGGTKPKKGLPTQGNFHTKAKETGHLWPYYIYMTVFIRNAANMAHILPKASRTTFTSEVFL